MLKKTIAALAIAMAAIPAQASFWTGNMLNELVESNVPADKTAVYGFVAGVVDVTGGDWLCLPREVTLAQASDVVKAYLRANPEMRHKPAAVLVTLALYKPWGCADKKKNMSSGKAL